ncbi:MAG TPA: VOC family protein [Bryobacteraceae bacterium]|nr:VOC family protein [Bryobacteraceae bacterium]
MKATTLSNSPLVAMIPTRDRKRSKVFYAGKLGLKLVSEDPFAMEFDAHGTQLRITTVPELTPHKFSVMSWYVKDVRAVIQELAAARVKFEMFDGLPQDRLGIWTAPDGTQVAWFKDPDGNLLGIAQRAG